MVDLGDAPGQQGLSDQGDPTSQDVAVFASLPDLDPVF